MRVTEQAWAVAYGDIFSRETIDATMEELRESDVTRQLTELLDDDSEQLTGSDETDEDLSSSESGGIKKIKRPRLTRRFQRSRTARKMLTRCLWNVTHRLMRSLLRLPRDQRTI
ncbi:hypothetical protein ACFQL7_24525 [Halocatena marina]|uniref:Uncharacterized protein n=1 Tax=Halocatena marina TaxID=2934937 RepID=A0ABD5YU94_9EURY